MASEFQKTRICLAQVNTTVGDFERNLRVIKDAIEIAREKECGLIAFPELALCGYPPEDLLLNKSFVRTNKRFIKKVAAEARRISVICGYVGSTRNSVFNSAAVAEDGQIKLSYNKIALPNYGVFDEKRYFMSGSEIPLLRIGSALAALNICEDIWVSPGVTERQAGFGAKLIINISASPYHMRRVEERVSLLEERACANQCHVAYVNLVGGQDELVFDGASMVVAPDGEIVSEAKAFAEDQVFVDLNLEPVAESVSFDLLNRTGTDPGGQFSVNYLELASARRSGKAPPVRPRKREAIPAEEEAYLALVLGTRDYLRKNGFSSAVVGLSGGIDSALTLAVAVEALGAKAVHAIFMPSQYTSELSVRAAEKQAKLLGCEMQVISIDSIYDSYRGEMELVYDDILTGLTAENLQARIRGNILMAYSNRTGAIVLNTSNKSEASVGYTTLYGDMIGGFAVLKDIPKTLVYAISRHLNKSRKREIVAEEIIERLPTAELKANQTDFDSLPPYEDLDEILRLYVELDTDESDIIKHGFDRKVVRRVIRMVRSSEYKRRQSPPGIKVTPRAFGRDRRWPITNKF